jgi:small subunit ribosomal protein S20
LAVKGKSAIKRAAKAQERQARNYSVRTRVRSVTRKAAAAVGTDDAVAMLREAHSTIDKAATKGVIHKNTAARKKARLAKRLHAAQQAAQA